MESRAQLREVRPLSKRLQVVHRFAGFHFDHCLKLASTLCRQENEIWIDRRRASADGSVPLSARIDTGLELAPALRLEQPDHAVVLELFADRADQNGAHAMSPWAPAGGLARSGPRPA